MLLSFVDNEQTYLAINPSLFTQAWLSLKFGFELPVFKFSFQIEMTPLRLIPFDLQTKWQVGSSDLCYSVSLVREVFDIRFRLKSEVYECALSLLENIRTGQAEHCLWETYEPTLSLYEKSLLPRFETAFDIVEWRCSNSQDDLNYYDHIQVIEGEE